MSPTPIEIMNAAYETAVSEPIELILAALPEDFAQDLRLIADKAATQKAVLGVTLTSLAYKIYDPSQDIRLHQDGMEGGYSGRTFDTKYVTPFLQNKFPHFAMAESAWLTRSLEQSHPYTLNFPGKIRIARLKLAFLNSLDRIEADHRLATPALTALFALLQEISAKDDLLFAAALIDDKLTIAQIVEAVRQHIQYKYGRGVVGAARIPVLAVYAIYNLLLPDLKRYEGKILAPLATHTSPDFRSNALGDIDINHVDGKPFEAVEIKHNKSITAAMISVAYRKFKDSDIDRYYILTTNEPNFADYKAVKEAVEQYKRLHSCQIVVNGVIPSLNYYLRLVAEPQKFVAEYTKWLEYEYSRASGIKAEHLRAWQEIRRTVLNEGEDGS